MRLDLDACCVVVAHPDDEVLWASSIVSDVRRVVLCYGDVPGNAALSAGRRRAVAALPLPGLVTLDIPETGAYGRADWPGPAPSRAGLALRDDLLGAAAAQARYAATYDHLVAALDPHSRTSPRSSRTIPGANTATRNTSRCSAPWWSCRAATASRSG